MWRFSPFRSSEGVSASKTPDDPLIQQVSRSDLLIGHILNHLELVLAPLTLAFQESEILAL